jgi:hypothetical protein
MNFLPGIIRTMNTNRDASIRTRALKARALTVDAENIRKRAAAANTNASIQNDFDVGNLLPCCTEPIPTGPEHDTILFTTVGTTTWRAPANVSSISLLVVGGGGGGGAAYPLQSSTDGINANPNRGGPGGGGGAGGRAVKLTTYSVTPGQTYTIVVGGGGAGGTATLTSETNASAGSDSSFDTVIGYGGGRGYGSRQFRNCAEPPYQGLNYCGSFRGGPNSDIGLPNTPPGGGNGGTYNGSPDYVISGGGGGGSTEKGDDGNYGLTGNEIGAGGGQGGDGLSDAITGTTVEYGKGGKGGNAGANDIGSASPENIGRGGDGAGAGANTANNGRAGGSGIVIISW